MDRNLRKTRVGKVISTACDKTIARIMTVIREKEIQAGKDSAQ